MPQVMSWKCPRSGALFEAKSAYVEHLRRLATEAIIRRPLETSFSALKQSATSPTDVGLWLVKYGRACIQMESNLDEFEANPAAGHRNLKTIHPLATVSGANITEEYRVTRYREYRVDFEVSVPNKNSDQLGHALQLLGGINVIAVMPTQHRNASRFTVVFEPEQWIFAAKSILYCNLWFHSQGQIPAHVANEDVRIQALLGLHFPGLPKRSFIEYAPFIDLLDADEEAFGAWIDQYRDGNFSDICLPLPEVDTTLDGTTP
jgi:hypothetical protein